MPKWTFRIPDNIFVPEMGIGDDEIPHTRKYAKTLPGLLVGVDDREAIPDERKEFERGDIVGVIGGEDRPSGMAVDFRGKRRANDTGKVDGEADEGQQVEPAIGSAGEILRIDEALIEMEGALRTQNPCQLGIAPRVAINANPVP